jgi:hypothetical protein
MIIVSIWAAPAFRWTGGIPSNGREAELKFHTSWKFSKMSPDRVMRAFSSSNFRELVREVVRTGSKGRAREPISTKGVRALADLSTATTAVVAGVHGTRTAGTRPGGGIGTYLSRGCELGEDDAA